MTNTMEPSLLDATVRYLINRASSKFTVQAFAGGLLSAFGHNPIIAISGFSGEAQLSENLERSSLVMTVDATSLKVASDVSDKDRTDIERLMHDKVLQSAEYPEIIYSCSRVAVSKTDEGQYWVGLNGDLTLHGVTRGLSVPARVTVDEKTLKAFGSFSLLQSDYEIELVSFAGGALKVKDELKLSFQIVATKQG